MFGEPVAHCLFHDRLGRESSVLNLASTCRRGSCRMPRRQGTRLGRPGGPTGAGLASVARTLPESQPGGWHRRCWIRQRPDRQIDSPAEHAAAVDGVCPGCARRPRARQRMGRQRRARHLPRRTRAQPQQPAHPQGSERAAPQHGRPTRPPALALRLSLHSEPGNVGSPSSDHRLARIIGDRTLA